MPLPACRSISISRDFCSSEKADEAQIALWKAVAASANKTSAELAVVLINGGVLDIEELVAEESVGAIVEAWYPVSVWSEARDNPTFQENATH